MTSQTIDLPKRRQSADSAQAAVPSLSTYLEETDNVTYETQLDTHVPEATLGNVPSNGER